jgi:cyclopropane fatty-acyl-phospholipid synthase-like methyltransferase
MFDKIAMHGGLQYFKKRDFPKLLRGMGAFLNAGGSIVLAAIPDANRKSAFYNTPVRRLKYLRDRLLGRDQMGTWWDMKELERVCASEGFTCTFLRSAYSTGTDYRFDVRITRA